MSIQITSRQIPLSNEMKTYIEGNIPLLNKFGEKIKIINTVAIASKEGKSIKFELNLTIAKHGQFNVKHVKDDFYSAVDQVFATMEDNLAGLHEKLSQVNRQKIEVPYVEEDFDDLEEAI
jgi:ribosomal subunit interface protein